MRRRYNTAQFARAVDRLRAVVPEVAITTDIIGGFPGETEADHAATLAFARAMAFSRIHVFPYSPRRGTPAATLPDHVPDAVRERRCADLRALGAELAADYHRRWLGQTVRCSEERGNAQCSVPSAQSRGPVLPEHLALSTEHSFGAEHSWSGYTDAYIRVVASAPAELDLAGRATSARLVALAGDAMSGKLAFPEAGR